MTLTNVQIEAIVRLLARRYQITKRLRDLVFVPPVDLEASKDDALAAAKQELDAARANRPPTRAEYVKIVQPLIDQYKALEAERLAVDQRNDVKIQAARATLEATAADLRAQVDAVDLEIEKYCDGLETAQVGPK